MSYTPKTDAELAEESLLPEGAYDFEIVDTSDKPSKKGNDMFTFKLWVFDTDGTHRYIFDYIAMGHPLGERKLRHAAVACGLLDIYNSGQLKADDFHGKSGKALLKKQNGTPDYPLPKNVVIDYVVPEEGADLATKQKKTKEIIDDDLPF